LRSLNRTSVTSSLRSALQCVLSASERGFLVIPTRFLGRLKIFRLIENRIFSRSQTRRVAIMRASHVIFVTSCCHQGTKIDGEYEKISQIRFAYVHSIVSRDRPTLFIQERRRDGKFARLSTRTALFIIVHLLSRRYRSRWICQCAGYPGYSASIKMDAEPQD